MYLVISLVKSFWWDCKKWFLEESTPFYTCSNVRLAQSCEQKLAWNWRKQRSLMLVIRERGEMVLLAWCIRTINNLHKVWSFHWANFLENNVNQQIFQCAIVISVGGWHLKAGRGVASSFPKHSQPSKLCLISRIVMNPEVWASWKGNCNVFLAKKVNNGFLVYGLCWQAAWWSR